MGEWKRPLEPIPFFLSQSPMRVLGCGRRHGRRNRPPSPPQSTIGCAPHRRRLSFFVFCLFLELRALATGGHKITTNKVLARKRLLAGSRLGAGLNNLPPRPTPPPPRARGRTQRKALEGGRRSMILWSGNRRSSSSTGHLWMTYSQCFPYVGCALHIRVTCSYGPCGVRLDSNTGFLELSQQRMVCHAFGKLGQFAFRTKRFGTTVSKFLRTFTQKNFPQFSVIYYLTWSKSLFTSL